MREMLVSCAVAIAFGAPAVAQDLGLVELRIEGLDGASVVSTPSGQTMIVALREEQTHAWVTPNLIPGNRRVDLLVVDGGLAGDPGWRRTLAIGETLEVVIGGTWVRITPTATEESSFLLSFTNDVMNPSKQLPGLNTGGGLCCLDSGGATYCGCRVRIGNSCCAEAPCSCVKLY